MNAEEKESIYERQLIDCNCNDCFHLERDFESTKKHKESYEGTGLSDNLLYGTCLKKEESITFIPNVCMIETQECFKHRKL